VRAIGQVELRAGRPRRVFGLVQDITERRRVDREILEIEREDQARTVSSLRDDLGQSLTGMSLMLRSMASQTQEPRLAREADQLIVLMNRAIGSCRALAKEISPVSEAHGGLIRAVRELAQAYGQARGVTATVRSHGKLPALLEEPSASHLYKIAQSAIARVLQATGISHLVVTINSTHDSVILAASGVGAAIGEDDSKAARELSILQRRAEILGAVLKIESLPRGGERITCTIHVPTTRRGPNLLDQNPALAGHHDPEI
jgi:signal transduction histidine kinase